MGSIYRKTDRFCYSMLRETHSLLDLRLLEFCSTRFVWRGKHSLSFNRIFTVLKGGGVMHDLTAGEKHELNPGSTYFIPPGIELLYDFSPDTSLASLHFQLHILPCVDVFDGESRCRELSVPGCREELMAIMANPTDWNAFCRFQSLNWKLFAALGEPDPARMTRLAGLCGEYGRALAYIRDNINADMGVDEVAAVAEAKRDTFSRHFSHDFGIPLKTFIMNELMATSERYLLHSGLPVREIASELRFSSEFYFSTFFRRLKGVSPTRFRSMRRKI